MPRELTLGGKAMELVKQNKAESAEGRLDQRFMCATVVAKFLKGV